MMEISDEEKRQLIHDTAQEAQTYQALGQSWQVRLKLSELEAMRLIGALQLVLRHPAFPHKPTGRFIRKLVDRLIAACPDDRPALKRLLLLGDRKDFDL